MPTTAMIGGSQIAQQQHMQMQQIQMQPEMQTQMQTGTLTTTPFGNPVDYPVDVQGMQLDDPEAPLDDVSDEVTDRSIQEFIDNFMKKLSSNGV